MSAGEDYFVAVNVMEDIISATKRYMRGRLSPTRQLLGELRVLFTPYVNEVMSRYKIRYKEFSRLVNTVDKSCAVIYDAEGFAEECIVLANLSDAEIRIACDVNSDLYNIAVYRFLLKGDVSELLKIIRDWLGDKENGVASKILQDVLDSLLKQISVSDIVGYMMMFPDDIDGRVIEDLLKMKEKLYTLKDVYEVFGDERYIQYILNKLDLLGIDRGVISRILENASDASNHPYYLVVLYDKYEAVNVATVFKLDERAPRGTVAEFVASKRMQVRHNIDIEWILSGIFHRLDIDKFKRFLQHVTVVNTKHAKELLNGLAEAVASGYSLVRIDRYHIVLLPMDDTAMSIIVNGGMDIMPVWALLSSEDVKSASIEKWLYWERYMSEDEKRAEYEKVFRYLTNNEILSKLPQDIAEKIIEKFYEHTFTS